MTSSTTASSRSISPTCDAAPTFPPDIPGLKHVVVSHRDAPLDGGLRERSLFDVGGRFHQLMGCPRDTLVLVRPDDHIAAMTPMGEGCAHDLYRKVVGHPQVCSTG